MCTLGLHWVDEHCFQRKISILLEHSMKIIIFVQMNDCGSLVNFLEDTQHSQAHILLCGKGPALRAFAALPPLQNLAQEDIHLCRVQIFDAELACLVWRDYEALLILANML